jgi:AraC-like DNA-binding protein
MFRTNFTGQKLLNTFPVSRFPFILSGLLFIISATSQKLPDSLASKSFTWFAAKLESDRLDNKTAKAYACAFLAKAKTANDANHMVDAYKALVHLSIGNERLHYADSMIGAARSTKSDAEIGAAYLTKGIVFYDQKNHNKALANYLNADKYISRTDDSYLQHKVKFNIAQIKLYLGFYDEALSLFNECVAYYKNEGKIPYLASLHSLGLCYNRIGKYNECTAINDKGTGEAVLLGYPNAVNRFLHSEGINRYFRQEYGDAIEKLTKSLPAITKAGDFGNEAVANFYIGKSYWSLKEQKKAISYFLKADRAFYEKNYIRPDMREMYELLIGYYAGHKNIDSQLVYVDRLLKADHFLEANYKYLSGRIHKEYDTRKLMAAKEALEASAGRSRHWYYTVTSTLLIALLGMVFLFFRAKKRNKKRFEELMRQTPKLPVRKMEDGDIGISPDVVASLLQRLEKFEANKRYLEQDMSLTRMAEIFKSNTKYVSRVIQYHKGKKSNDYINGLRIAHIVEFLKTNSRARHYTHKALAEEAGFSTTQHFTRAFLAHTGISPSYFIAELKKEGAI